MQLKKVALKDLISPEYNPREISKEEMAKLKRSITELGYSEPIIVNDVNNVIIAGNQRYRALQELGTEEIEVIFIHEPVPAREKALNIALNKIDGEFDTEKLSNIFKEFQLEGFDDITLTGFDDVEIEILTDDINFDDFFQYDDEEEELPDDFVDVEGDSKTNYQIIITVNDKEIANKIMEKLGTDKRMTHTSCVLTENDLNGFI